MAKLSEAELKHLQECRAAYLDMVPPALGHKQLEKILFNEPPLALLIDNFPGHRPRTAEGDAIIRVDEADIRKLVEESAAASKPIPRDTMFTPEEIALGNSIVGWDRPGAKWDEIHLRTSPHPRRFYLSEARLWERLDALEPGAIQPMPEMAAIRPSLDRSDLEALIKNAAVVRDVPGMAGQIAYRLTEKQLEPYAPPRGRGFSFSHRLGYLVCAYDEQPGGGERRYYLSKARLMEHVADFPPNHDDIYNLQRAKDADLNDVKDSKGRKEFKYSTLERLLGPLWEGRLMGHWEKAISTGTEEVASVDMAYYSQRMRDDKTKRDTPHAGYRRRYPGDGGFGGRRF
jgi:hypothetical protein